MTAGCFLSSAGVSLFAVSAGVPVTGVAGITSILYRLFDLPMGIMNVLINIPIILFTYKTLGKKYFIRSAYCVFAYAFFTDAVLPLLNAYRGDRLLSVICCAIVMTIGDAMIYMSNASTGGLDFLTVSIKVKNPHIPLGYIVFAFSLFIILVNGFLFKDIDSIIYGLIMNYISSMILNRIMSGFNQTMMMLIVTKKGKMICDLIAQVADRGSTILKGCGGFRLEEKDVVMCACSPKELYQIEKSVKKYDPESFVIMMEASEVHGEGFSHLKLGNNEDVAA